MKHIARQVMMAVALTALLTLVACGAHSTEPQVEGHYTYEHAFEYDLHGNHFDVHETGTMDFYPNGSALDSARQVYTATLWEGGTVTYVFDYVSPSRWSLEGDTFRFAGIKEDFSMKLDSMSIEEGCDSVSSVELANKVISIIGGSIDYEYRFHLDTLTADKMQWSFTYRGGHSDIWEFFREVTE